MTPAEAQDVMFGIGLDLLGAVAAVAVVLLGLALIGLVGRW